MKIAAVDGNGVVAPLMNTFELLPLTSITEEKNKPQALVVWNDILQDFHMMCVVANKHDILTFMVQHGRGGMRDYLGEHEQVANVAFVWTEEDKKTAIKGGWKPESVFVVGAPWFSERPKRNKQNGLVVFDAVHWDREVEENYIAWSTLNKIPNIIPVAKLINSHDESKFPGNTLKTDRMEIGHIQKTYELLAQAECVVTMMHGTLELMAYSLGVPVIFLDEFKGSKLKGTYQGKEDLKPSDATIKATFKTLPLVVHKVLNGKHGKEKEMRAELLKYAGDPDKDRPVAKMTEIIKELVKKHEAKNTGLEK